jgi:pimeloyl-ACP methyl ester carboxylesterase
MLLDDIGPAILVSHGDASLYAWVVADERPDLVKGVVALEPAPLQDGFLARVPNLPRVPTAIVTAEASRANESDPATAAALRQAGVAVDHLELAARGIRGNGPFMMLERNSREVLQPVAQWIEARAAGVPVPPQPPAVVESLALSLADQGHFWVGVQRKPTPYGTIAVGQSFVQYFIPRQVRHRYPVVLIHGGAGQATHMMGIGRRPGFAHYFVQDGYQVYVMDRPGFGRVPYHPDSLGPSHLQNFGAVNLGGLLSGPQGPGRTGLRGEDIVTTFVAFEAGNVTDLAFHSELFEKGIGELLARIGPAILLTHAYSGTLGWLAADRNPTLVKAHFAAEVNFNPFEGPTTWGLTALPVAYDPPVSDPREFQLVDVPLPPDSPGPANRTSFKLQSEPARRLTNLRGIPMACLATERYPLGSAPAQVADLRQAGCTAELIRLRDLGIQWNTNLFIFERNNKEVYGVIRDWLATHAS